jgi:hypothetical protein
LESDGSALAEVSRVTPACRFFVTGADAGRHPAYWMLAESTTVSPMP